MRQKFTLYERDTETGLDYAKAPYFSSWQGRFTSADPLMASAKATDPQTWNRYSYVTNSPLKFVDPSGMIMGKRKDGEVGDISVLEGTQYSRGTLYGFTESDVAEYEAAQQERQKDQEVQDVIKFNTNEANILAFSVNLVDIAKDRYGKEGVPIGGEFEIYYKYYIPLPEDGSKPETYGKITPIIPATGGSPRGTFSDTSFVELVKTTVKVNPIQEGVTVEKTERFSVKKDPYAHWNGTYQINYRIAVTNPKTRKTVDRSSVEKSGFRGRKIPQPIPVLVVPKRR